ncbi:hypothetical protein KVR01_000664 [Diaporthe batatas]|uniref:uncharacterized protein n=1 Tax=Diaporthe batatas TaxID=748121 RepID=UPI001D04EE64|nr:uncharacterized protein KVR01_000664 [Diaporthe batatas]KAG8169919.1 hypothetical protein KVR01_000664 [Diaporthe batatas]
MVRVAMCPENSANQQGMPQAHRFPLLSLPAEIRNNIYREALITPDIVRSLVPPALLQTSRAIRNEALAMYYTHNAFEITVKRGPEHRSHDAHVSVPIVDKFALQRFSAMWADFNNHGSDVLRYVTRITLIYELSMTTGCGFGHDPYDGRVGLRFLSGTREEDQDPSYGEPGFGAGMDNDRDEDESDSGGSGSDTDSDASDEEFRGLNAEEVMELDAELADLNIPDDPFARFRTNWRLRPADDFAEVGVFEVVTGGNFNNWQSRTETYNLLRDQVGTYCTDIIWQVYPLKRLAKMLRRCAIDCPLAAQNIDFLCDEYQHWMEEEEPYRPFHSGGFYDPDRRVRAPEVLEPALEML